MGDTFSGSATRWIFLPQSYHAGVDPTQAALWVDGRLPKAVYADGVFPSGEASSYVFMSGYSSRIDNLNFSQRVSFIAGTTIIGTQTWFKDAT